MDLRECCKKVKVEFDYEDAKNLSTYEVRKKYPRKSCPECGCILYASFEHYICGDY